MTNPDPANPATPASTHALGMTMTADEHELLRSLPQAIGSAMAVVDRSGLFGVGKELWASGQAVLAGAKDFPGNALIKALVPDPQAADRGGEFDKMRATRDWYAARLKAAGVDSADKLVALALTDAAEADALLRRVAASTDEADGYRRWALGIAEKVAQAATEGGFLGFGGERLSPKEKDLLGRLRTALGMAAA